MCVGWDDIEGRVISILLLCANVSECVMCVSVCNVYVCVLMMCMCECECVCVCVTFLVFVFTCLFWQEKSRNEIWLVKKMLKRVDQMKDFLSAAIYVRWKKSLFKIWILTPRTSLRKQILTTAERNEAESIQPLIC